MIPYSLERVIGISFPITNPQAALQLAPDNGVQLDDLIGKGFDGHSRGSSGAFGCFYQTKTTSNQ